LKDRAFALGLGGNLGDVPGNLRRCVASLAATPGVSSLKVAPIYETPPWGGVSGGNFLNTVVCGFWRGTDTGLLEVCRELELQAGSRTDKNGGARTLDVDVLFLQGGVSTPELTLPHPGIPRRRFVLVPLADVWSEVIPGMGNTPAELLQSVEDDSSIIFRGSLEAD